MEAIECELQEVWQLEEVSERGDRLRHGRKGQVGVGFGGDLEAGALGGVLGRGLSGGRGDGCEGREGHEAEENPSQD